jgi:phage baseplate assembly protein W
MSLYSDLNQSTPKTNPLVYGADSIYQSITNILSTPTHTRLFQLEFGSDIETLLFEPMDEIIVIKLYDAIVDAINKWDDRVSVSYNESSVTPIYEENKYELLLIFKISGFDEDFEYKGELVRP